MSQSIPIQAASVIFRWCDFSYQRRGGPGSTTADRFSRLSAAQSNTLVIQDRCPTRNSRWLTQRLLDAKMRFW
jgi:hypothetical protein